jgi:hypothetical protein
MNFLSFGLVIMVVARIAVFFWPGWKLRGGPIRGRLLHDTRLAAWMRASDSLQDLWRQFPPARLRTYRLRQCRRVEENVAQ